MTGPLVAGFYHTAGRHLRCISNDPPTLNLCVRRVPIVALFLINHQTATWRLALCWAGTGMKSAQFAADTC